MSAFTSFITRSSLSTVVWLLKKGLQVGGFVRGMRSKSSERLEPPPAQLSSPRLTTREALDAIEGIILRADAPSEVLDVLSALRGPDVASWSEQIEVKARTTAHIRKAAFPTLWNLGTGWSPQITGESVIFISDEEAFGHFGNHVRGAAAALGIRWAIKR